jgi:chromosome segregation protein
MGMAEVSLLLDNEDGTLPVDFAEVEIARRAYRSGVNEYLLNRRRVRLQDILEMLGGLSASYVVIHQGMVDEALSLRPKERRILLEEAAEVHRYHERRQKALDRLERTSGNITRVSDLQRELVPRMRSLERQSKQARRRAEAESALQATLRQWYRLLWEEASTFLTEARHEEERTRVGLEQTRSRLKKAATRADTLRESIREVQRRQTERRQEEIALRQQQEDLRQSIAQVEGERRALQRYQEDLRAEIDRWRKEVSEQEDRRAQLHEARVSLNRRVEQTRTDLQQQETTLEQAETDLKAPHLRREDLQQRLLAVSVRILEMERRLENLTSRKQGLEEEESERQIRLTDLSELEQRFGEDKRKAQEELNRLDLALTARAEEEARLRDQIVESRGVFQRATESLEQARLHLAEKRARYAILSEATATDDGAPFLQTWARQQGRAAFSVFLSLLTVPAELDHALEAALGEHATALLAEGWQEAQAALEAVSSSDAGRVTLLPRSEIRSPETTLPSKVVGVSRLLDHVSCPEVDRPALEALLGRVLLANSLVDARRVSQHLPPGWVVVTRRGHLVTAEGVFRGGRSPSARSILAREREHQSLSKVVAEAEEACSGQKAAYEAAKQRLEECEEVLTESAWQRDELRRAHGAQTHRVQELDGNLLRIMEEGSRYRERLDALQEERHRLEEEVDALKPLLHGLRADQALLQAELQDVQRTEEAAQKTYATVQASVQEARTAWAVIQKEKENFFSLEEMYQRNCERLQQQIREGQDRLQATVTQIEEWNERSTALRAEIDQVSASMDQLAEEVWTSPASLDELAHLDKDVARWREEVMEWEGLAGRSQVEVQRREDRLKEVLRRGLAEVGPEASAYGPAGDALLSALLDDPPEWTRTPLDRELSPEELERRIAHLREEIRQIGPVNPLAENEYRETRERHDFLEQQLADLREASQSLRKVIAELDEAMETSFRESFAAINQEFQAYFARLFGGGTARLELVRLDTDEEGLDSLGTEIIAKPPGKRAHSLALLSGGERALVSTALLFAILKVNPRPFCLLDEVDAMLDEANVGRFRECLEELTDQTQFILITHNRGTIGVANTLYGVSLHEDGTSRLLSLRLEDALQD